MTHNKKNVVHAPTHNIFYSIQSLKGPGMTLNEYNNRKVYLLTIINFIINKNLKYSAFPKVVAFIKKKNVTFRTIFKIGPF